MKCLHIFWNERNQDGHIEGSYSSYNEAVNGLAQIFKDDYAMQCDYLETMITDNGHVFLEDMRTVATETAAELQQEENFEAPRAYSYEYEAV